MRIRASVLVLLLFFSSGAFALAPIRCTPEVLTAIRGGDKMAAARVLEQYAALGGVIDRLAPLAGGNRLIDERDSSMVEKTDLIFLKQSIDLEPCVAAAEKE